MGIVGGNVFDEDAARPARLCSVRFIVVFTLLCRGVFSFYIKSFAIISGDCQKRHFNASLSTYGWFTSRIS